MRNGRKYIRIIVSAMLILSILAGISAFAVDDTLSNPAVKVETVHGEPGKQVDVEISIENDPGILGATLQIFYDPSLTLVNAKQGDAFSSLTMTKPGAYESPCKFVWDGQDINSDSKKSGVILTLTFCVSSEAVEGDVLPIGISYETGDIVDSSLQPVAVETTNGSVTVASVSENPSVIISAMGERKDDSIVFSAKSNGVFEGASVLLATYSDVGKLLGCICREIRLDAGDNEFVLNNPYLGSAQKVFLVDESMRPLWDAITITDSVETGGVAIEVGTNTARCGESDVEVNIEVRNNPGILGMTLSVSYDGNALLLTDARNGEAVNKVLSLTKPGQFTSPCRFVWDGQEILANQIADGVILTLKFDIADTASAGTYPIEVSYADNDIINGELEPVQVSVKQGSIEVSK